MASTSRRSNYEKAPLAKLPGAAMRGATERGQPGDTRLVTEPARLPEQTCDSPDAMQRLRLLAAALGRAAARAAFRAEAEGAASRFGAALPVTEL